MNILILYICLTLTLAISAGVFYWGYKLGHQKKVSEDNQIHLINAMKQISEMEEVIRQMEYALEQSQGTPKIDKPRTGGWNPADPLNSDRR